MHINSRSNSKNMKYKAKLRLSLLVNFLSFFLIGVSLLLMGVLIDGLELYQNVGGVGIGLIMCLFAVIYLRLNTKIKVVSINDGALEIGYSNGHHVVFHSNKVGLIENDDGSRYFCIRIEGQNRNIIIDPKNFNHSKEMFDSILKIMN